MSKPYKKHIFDNIHGYIHLTRAEDRIVNTAYYQRLRWVRQLGFTFYIFPGATHTRFSHALGVLHLMDRILKAIGKAAPEHLLFDPDYHDPQVDFHRLMRMAALLHDIGTFPFSHTCELGYIAHWKKKKAHGIYKGPPNNHEVIGQHIILNTDFKGGITKILKEEGIDPSELSKTVAGTSSSLIANQLMHADVDADRMDYLLRDAHHTGVKVGTYDLELLLRNLVCTKVGDQEALAVREDAVHVVEYFLISRYSWYSQVIDEGTGYKFDLIAAKITEYFLENKQIYSFDQILNEITQDPDWYFTFNDNYFFAKIHEFLASKNKHPMIRELTEMLAYRQPPKQVKEAPFEPTLVRSLEHRQELVKTTSEAAHWLETELRKHDPEAWMIFDIPSRDVMFTKSLEALKRDEKTGGDPVLSRDAVKIFTRQGETKLLITEPGSLMQILSQYRNFIPRIYVGHGTYELLEKNKILEALHAKYAHT